MIPYLLAAAGGYLIAQSRKSESLFADGGKVSETAMTILSQLGGAGRLNAMTGAYLFTDLGNGVAFRLKNPRANWVKILLNGKDLYDIEVGRIRGTTYKVVATRQDVYFDEMKPFLEEATGLYFTMPRVRFDEGGGVDGGMMAKGDSIWTEIRDDFEEDGVVYIDAWTTSDDNEEGKVIAKVKENGEVIYLDERAKKDSLAQEVINDVKKSKKSTGGYMAKGGEIADIDKMKKSLIQKAKSKGIYENFGQKEVRQLEDKYGYTPAVQKFDEWAMNFDLSQNLSQMADGGDIAKGGEVEIIVHGKRREYSLGKFKSTAAAKRYLEEADLRQPYTIKKLSVK